MKEAFIEPWQEYLQALRRTGRTHQLDHAMRVFCILQAINPVEVESYMRKTLRIKEGVL
jgi:hypothetical protein